MDRGTEISLWEISPSAPAVTPTNIPYAFQNTEQPFDSQLIDQYTDTMLYSTEDTADPESEFFNEQAARAIRLVRPKIAVANVHHKSDQNSTRFDVTRKLVSWLKRRKRLRTSGPLLRYLLFVCAKCDSVPIVDPKKVS